MVILYWLSEIDIYIYMVLLVNGYTGYWLMAGFIFEIILVTVILHGLMAG